jgi:sigma-54-specific transcriptional regulator
MSRGINRSALPFPQDPAPATAPMLLTAPGPQTSPRIVAASALMFEDPGSKEIAAQICRLAPSDATILITGETGTGKEIVARYIHSLSQRRAARFVAVNCAALTESLAESELFGHERGAFTGAQGARAGWFEAAQGGTLFLDEIGELSLPIQAKLLRVLQEREVVRVGSQRAIPVDIRLLTATNVNLERAVQAGRFRKDLYYRINLATLSLAPLRERPGDLWPLAQHFLQLYRERLGLGDVSLSAEALALMGRYPWPGNIRELENVIHYALLVSTGPLVTATDLHLPQFGPVVADAGAPFDTLEAALRSVLTQPGANRYQTVSDTLVRAALDQCDGNQVRTAALLGVSRNVLRGHLARLGVVARRERKTAKQ